MTKCEDQKITPIQKAIETVVETMGLNTKYQCFVDWDKSNLEELAKSIVESSDKHDANKVLFIKTPIEKLGKEVYQPWITLLEFVIRKTNIGIVANLNKIIPEILKHNSLPSVPIKKVDIDGNALSILTWDELETEVEIKRAPMALTAWAKLESFSDLSCPSVFSHLAGGLRPLVAIFDDYNNYIQNDSGKFLPINVEDLDEIAARYEEKAEEFHKILKAYCQNLNNLSISFDIYAPKLWVSEEGGSGYEQVAQVLPFKVLEGVRDRLCAFIVDFEWRPTLSTMAFT